MRAILLSGLLVVVGCSGAPSSGPTARAPEASEAPKRLPRNLLALTLGADISSVPACAVRRGVELGFWEQAALPCLKRHGATAEELRDGVRLAVQFAPDKVPPGIKDRGDVLVIGGIIQSIELDTDGNDSQFRIQELLEEKFGPPGEKSVDQAANAMGATFPNITAGWSDGSVMLYHFGLMSQIDSGSVHFMTAEAKAWDAARAAASKRGF